MAGTRKSRGRKADPIKTIAPQTPNDHLIRDAISMGLSGPDDGPAILAILQRHPQNVDTILDEDTRDAAMATMVAENRLAAPLTDADRVERVLEMAGASSTETGEQEWISLLSPDRAELADVDAYRELLLKRLREQIRAVRRKVRDSSRKAAAKLAAHEAEHDGPLAVSWSVAADSAEEVERIATGDQSLDVFFGYDEVEGADGVVKVGGLTAGHTYIVGAPHGMGKTRWLVDFMARLCGATGTDEHGRTYGGMRGLYIQGEETPQRFASMFAEGVWEAGTHDVHLSDSAVFMAQHERLIRELQPDIVVIDSKDIMEDWKHPQQAAQNVKRYNRWAVEYGFVLFVISHVNAEGRIKGGTNLPHMFRAEIIGTRNEHDPSMFSLRMGKNRGSQGGGVVHYKHGPDTVHLVDPGKGGAGVIKTEMMPDAALLSGMASTAANRGAPESALLTQVRERIAGAGGAGGGDNS